MRSFPGHAQLLSILALVYSTYGLAKSNTLVFSNHNATYCPYTLCEDNRSGYILELVKQIYADKGYKVIIRNEPWNRAVSLAEEGSVTGVIAVAKESSQKLLFPNTEVSQYFPFFYVTAKSTWTYSGKSSLELVKFGLVQGYGYDRGNPLFGEFIESDKKGRQTIAWITGDNASFRVLKMLGSGRIDVTIEDKNVVDYFMKKNMASGKFKQAGAFTTHPIKAYIAFSPKGVDSKELARIFDEGMEEFRKSGRLKTILDSYGLEDWANPIAKTKDVLENQALPNQG